MLKKPLLLLGLLTVLAVAAFFFPFQTAMADTLTLFSTWGLKGQLVFFLVYVLATVLLMPASLLTLGAGFVYGPFLGLALVSPASVLGATLACLLGRHAFRGLLESKVKESPKFAAVDKAIAQEGFKIVFLLRLSPILPFNLLNYGLGLTKIPMPQYILASFLGMLPATFLYVYIGSLATNIAQLLKGDVTTGPWQKTLYYGGLLATIIVTYLITKVARKALKKALGPQENSKISSQYLSLGQHEYKFSPPKPKDEFNSRLVDHTHPANHTNPTPKKKYDLVVIGGGTAGLVSAAGAAGLGARVALVERNLMGGDCLNTGCVPSKALLHAAHMPPAERPSFAQAMANLRKIRSHIATHDSVARFTNLGIDVFLGHASFTSPSQVKVGDSHLNFKRSFIATGARAAVPKIDGLENAGYLTNDTLFELEALPKRMAIIGAGPIGVEIAQAFAAFGCEISLIEGLDRILPREDSDAAALLHDILLREGVRLFTKCKVLAVEGEPTRKRIFLEHESGPIEIECDQIMLSVGRSPNLEGLNLGKAGVTATKKGVIVDDNMRTKNPSIFAIGDVASPYQFTHAADAMARMALQNAFFFGKKKQSALTIPWATYTRPELAHVGISQNEADKNPNCKTLKINFQNNDRSLLEEEAEGFLTVHYDSKKKGKILGATIVGQHAGEIIAHVSLCMTHSLTLGHISSTIFPYPTRSEVLKRAGDAYNKTRLTPFAARILKTVIRLMP